MAGLGEKISQRGDKRKEFKDPDIKRNQTQIINSLLHILTLYELHVTVQ
jgi:hypothetical protein